MKNLPSRARAASRVPHIASVVALLFCLESCGGDDVTNNNNAAAPPVIVNQPLNAAVVAGQPVTFSVSATGSRPLRYQWFRNSTSIAGTNSVTYAIARTEPGDHGSVFTVRVSNSAGSVESAPASLNVSVPVALLAEPQDVRASIGQNATFTVSVVGTPPISFQWRRNGVEIAGAAEASYTIPSVAVSDDGAMFSVAASNAAGAVTSRAATLVVVIPPSVITPPQDMSVGARETATFSVVAGGTPPLTYQWTRDGVDIAGATSNTFTISATQRADSASRVAVSVTNSAGSVTSPPATLHVIGIPVFGLGGFQPDLPETPGVIGARYRVRAVENESQFKLIFGWNHLYTPGADRAYVIESNVYSFGSAYSDGVCTTWPMQGTYNGRQTSLRLAIADYAYERGVQSGITTGLRTSDRVAYPTQNYLVDGIPKLWKTDAISQADVSGAETLITIERGTTVTDVTDFQRCGHKLLPMLYRVWTMRAETVGRPPVSIEFIAPEANASYLLPWAVMQMASEFLVSEGIFAVHYWDMAILRETGTDWEPVRSFVTGAQYDGNTKDFGVRVVNVDGQNRVEMSNRPGQIYLRGGTRFSF